MILIPNMSMSEQNMSNPTKVSGVGQGLYFGHWPGWRICTCFTYVCPQWLYFAYSDTTLCHINSPTGSYTDTEFCVGVDVHRRFFMSVC